MNNCENENIDFSFVMASSVHDMKNSVGMLLASLDAVIAESPPENEVQRMRYNSLNYEVSRINGELIQLLTIYRIQNKLLPVQIEEYDVIDVLEDQFARNHLLLQTAGINLIFQCDENLCWNYDPDLIGSVIHNVIVNCTRYTKSAIAVAAEVKNELLCITVADDGPGYPDTMLANPAGLIEEAECIKGHTQLGLYLAEKIASLHKQKNRCGFIKLENGEPLGGGVFKIYIP